MTILVILGGALVTILKQGITTWHVAEKRGAIYEKARIVLDQIAEDLRAASGNSQAEGAGFWVRFLCDQDSQGRARLRLTRAITESQEPVAREGGKFVETTAGEHIDLHGDTNKLRSGNLLAPGGYEEVLYAMDPDPGKPVLWRGIRAPIGGAKSLFIDRNIEEEDRRAKEKARNTPGKKPPAAPGVALAEAPPAAGDPRSGPGGTGPGLLESIAGVGPLAEAARPFADGILHISFAFWTPFTTTWDRGSPPRIRKGTIEKSGPILTWDSTRGILDEKAPEAEFAWRSIDGSLEDPMDDAFPERVEVTAVIAGNAEAGLLFLASDLSPTDKAVALSRTSGLAVEGPDRFVWIEGEWIAYDKIEGDRLILPSGKGAAGRGARGTKPGAHLRGAIVDPGTPFRRVVEIPTGRTGTLISEERRRRP